MSKILFTQLNVISPLNL